jgi:hypothetical protein
MEWIVNRKKYKPLLHIVTVLIYAVNMALFMVGIRFIYCIYAGMHTDWYEKSAMEMTENDIFFMEKSDMIFITLLITFLFIMIFALSVIWGYRKLLLMEMKRDLAVYFIQGYDKKQMFSLLSADCLYDLLVSVPYAFIITKIISIIVSRNHVYSLILSSDGQSLTLVMINIVLSFLGITLLLAIQSALCLTKIKKRGLAIAIKE